MTSFQYYIEPNEIYYKFDGPKNYYNIEIIELFLNKGANPNFYLKNVKKIFLFLFME